MNKRPIGIFDSGIGGLTVLKELQKIMPNEEYIYFADAKNIPYGNKTKEQILSYTDRIVKFLISKNVKAIVIACGTASSLAYEYLKETYDLPFFDVISPVSNSIHSTNIGIIATEASAKSHVWENKINAVHPNANVFLQACPKLVPLAEKNSTNSYSAKRAIHYYLKDLKEKNIDTLILRMYSLSFI